MSNRTADTDAHLMAGPGKTKMKAIVQNAYGDADVLRSTEIDKPVPGEHDVLVRVFAVSRLDQTPEAMTYVGAGHARGKVVILVKPDAEGA